MAIDNQIFEHYRIQELKITEAKNFLRRHGYSVKKSDSKKKKLETSNE